MFIFFYFWNIEFRSVIIHIGELNIILPKITMSQEDLSVIYLR